MCGVFGIVQRNAPWAMQQKLTNYIRMACVVGIVRGDDSTGLFQVDQKLKLTQHKLPISGYFFAGDKRANHLMGKADTSLITIGHHRAATVGDISRENSHPFEHYDDKRLLIGVHNGRVFNNKLEEDGKQFAVDSDWLMYRMFRDGAPKALSEMNGDIATCWYENDGKLRIYSNGKRALHWAFVKDANVMLIGSEHEMIYWCANKNGLEIEQAFWRSGNDQKIFVFDPDNVRKFEVIKLAEKPKSTYTPPVVPLLPRQGPNGPKDSTTTGSSGTNTSRFPSGLTTHRDFAGLVIHASKTFQGIPISHEPLAIRRLGLEYGNELEFHYSPNLPVNKESSNMLGEIMVEHPTKKDASGKPELISEYAMIAVCSNEERVSIRLASGTQQGRVICKVSGVTQLTLDGKDHTCVVLTPPVSYVHGNPSVLSKEEAPDEVDIALESMNQMQIPGPNKATLSLAEFQAATKRGCAVCSHDVTTGDALNKRVEWSPNSTGGFDPMHLACYKQMMSEPEGVIH